MDGRAAGLLAPGCRDGELSNASWDRVFENSAVQLPDYFLADIPDPAALSPAVLTDACLTLKSNRRRFLANRTTSDLIEVVSRLAED